MAERVKTREALDVIALAASPEREGWPKAWEWAQAHRSDPDAPIAFRPNASLQGLMPD